VAEFAANAQGDVEQTQANGQDHGLVKATKKKVQNPSSVLSSFVTNQQIIGQPGFIAPEIISHKQYSTACDIWALGCIAYAMLVGKPPFSGPDALKATLKGLSEKSATDSNISPEAWNLIENMTNLDRSKRYTAQQVLEHPWIASPPTFIGEKAINETQKQPTTDGGFLSSMIRAITKGAKPSASTRARRRWAILLSAIIFSIRLRSKREPAKIPSAGAIIRAFPPPAFNKLDSRRSTETSSGVSQLELRNQWLTLDGYAQRVRSENRLDELSPFFKYGGATNGNSSASGFTSIGISASVAGQLSELGGDAEAAREPIRPAGPFLAALEAHLEAEAGLLTSSSEEEDDDTEEFDERVTDKSVGSNPQGPTKFDLANRQSADHVVLSPGVVDEDEEEEMVSPKTARASAVRAWEELHRESQNDVE
jgi:hypothetical protein